MAYRVRKIAYLQKIACVIYLGSLTMGREGLDEKSLCCARKKTLYPSFLLSIPGLLYSLIPGLPCPTLPYYTYPIPSIPPIFPLSIILSYIGYTGQICMHRKNLPLWLELQHYCPMDFGIRSSSTGTQTFLA